MLRSPSGRPIRGSLHFAGNDEAVRRFGRDDDFFEGWVGMTAPTVGKKSACDFSPFFQSPYLRVTGKPVIRTSSFSNSVAACGAGDWSATTLCTALA
jgi:hypothetical protein